MRLKHRRGSSLLRNTMSWLRIVLTVLFVFVWSPRDNQAQNSPAGTTLQQLPADTMIRLERTDCFFTCQAYVVTIWADGLVTFEGKANVRVIGKAQTRIAVEKVRELVAMFLKTKYFSLRDQYNRAEDGCRINNGDTASAITSIVIGGRAKSVNRYLGCFPKKKHSLDGLVSLEEQIDEAANTNQWIE